MKDEIEGKAKEIRGKMTGDKEEEIEGKAQQGMDKARRTGRDIRDDIRDKADDMKNDGERDSERESEDVTQRRSW